MIIAHDQLLEDVESGRIHCWPFDLDMVGTNSIDVTLGRNIKIVRDNKVHSKYGDKGYIDPVFDQVFEEITMPDAGIILEPGIRYLAHTEEEIGSDFYVPIYEGRSSIARMFLWSHISAGFGEVGFKRQWTLELACVGRIRIFPGMRIGQVFFSTVSSNAKLYGRDIKAHYADQVGAQVSKY